MSSMQSVIDSLCFKGKTIPDFRMHVKQIDGPLTGIFLSDPIEIDIAVLDVRCLLVIGLLFPYSSISSVTTSKPEP